MSDKNLPVPVVTQIEPLHDPAMLDERTRVYGQREAETQGSLVKAAIETARRLAGKSGSQR